MLLGLAAIGAGVLVLRALVLRSEKKTGSLVKGAAGYPKVRIDGGVDLNHVIGTLPCPSNPPPPDGMAYWTGPVSAAQSAWAIHNLSAHPIGSIIEDVVDGEPIAARIEWHVLQAATGKSGCFKGLNLLRYLHPQELAAHAGGFPYVHAHAHTGQTVFIEVPGAGTFTQRTTTQVSGVTILRETSRPLPRDQVAGALIARQMHGRF